MELQGTEQIHVGDLLKEYPAIGHTVFYDEDFSDLSASQNSWLKIQTFNTLSEMCKLKKLIPSWVDLDLDQLATYPHTMVYKTMEDIHQVVFKSNPLL